MRTKVVAISIKLTILVTKSKLSIYLEKIIEGIFPIPLVVSRKRTKTTVHHTGHEKKLTMGSLTLEDSQK
jgi:hypothetical protein